MFSYWALSFSGHTSHQTSSLLFHRYIYLICKVNKYPKSIQRVSKALPCLFHIHLIFLEHGWWILQTSVIRREPNIGARGLWQTHNGGFTISIEKRTLTKDWEQLFWTSQMNIGVAIGKIVWQQRSEKVNSWAKLLFDKFSKSYLIDLYRFFTYQKKILVKKAGII